MGFKLGQKIIDIIRKKKKAKRVPQFVNFLDKKLYKDIRYVSFGDKNPDKVFFVIYRPNLGAGFLSNVRWVLRYLAVIKDTDLIPVIDDVNFKSFYSENEKINGAYSWWNYYFKPLSPYSLDEVYNSKHVLICNGTYVGGYKHYQEDSSITKIEISMYEKYLKFNDFFRDELNKDTRYNEMMEFLKTPTLGVQFRGSDMVYERKHLTPMTIKQALSHADKCLQKEGLSQIYLATECEDYKIAFEKYYNNKGVRVMCVNKAFGGVERLIKNVKSLSTTVFLAKGGVLLRERYIAGFAGTG